MRKEATPSDYLEATITSLDQYMSDVTYKGYVLNPEHWKHNKYSPDNIEKGKEGERMIQYFLRNKWGLQVIGNKLDDSYPAQRGADIWHKRSGFKGEVKNTSGNYSMDELWLKRQKVLEVLEGAKIKVLFVSLDRTTKEVRRILKENNIKLVEWGEQLLGQSWNKAISRLYTQLYPIYYRIRRYLISPSIIEYNIVDTNRECNKERYLLDRVDKLGTKKPPPARGGWYNVPIIQLLLGEGLGLGGWG